MKLTSLAAALTLTFSVVEGASVPRAALDVWVPPIISPSETTVWKAGAIETVTWDASNPPDRISNGAAVTIWGGDLPSWTFLVRDFDLRSGAVNVTIPADYKPGPYRITLFGDSGNISPYFEIVA